MCDYVYYSLYFLVLLLFTQKPWEIHIKLPVCSLSVYTVALATDMPYHSKVHFL